MKRWKLIITATMAFLLIAVSYPSFAAVPSRVTDPNTRFYGVFVGYNNQAETPSPEQDSQAIRDKLIQWWDDNPNYQPGDTTLINNGGATKAAITTAINNAKAKAQPGDEFIFFFSGHGSNSIIPDANSDEPDGYDNSLRVDGGRISDDELADMLSGFKESVTITVILNACYAGTFLDGTDDLPSVTQKDAGGHDNPIGPGHLEVLTSGIGTTPDGPGISPYVQKLLEGLTNDGTGKTKADKNKDNVTESKELHDQAGPATTLYLLEDNDGDGHLNEDDIDVDLSSEIHLLIDNDLDGSIDEDPGAIYPTYWEEPLPPPTGFNTYWLALLGLLAMVAGFLMMKREAFLRV